MAKSPAVHVHHTTSHALQFVGRTAELALLNEAWEDDAVSVVALVGPGGQGKTAIVQEWLNKLATHRPAPAGVFLWSFYRGKDSDHCLRRLLQAVCGFADAASIAASYCVDHILPRLRSERWAVVLDGAEVVQYESGPWAGRFAHPELGRLLEELASAPQAGVTVLTTRFSLPDLQRRPHIRIVRLDALDQASACGLVQTLGVRGTAEELHGVGAAAGWHAKAVELLGTYLARFHGGEASRLHELPEVARVDGMSEEEHKVVRVLAAYQTALMTEEKDILALATAFRDPPTTTCLIEFLRSQPVRSLLHEAWRRDYQPFLERPPGWVEEQVDSLITLRLLERVGTDWALGNSPPIRPPVIDAHPLVRRAFEQVLGAGGREATAGARAGFLRGRPDRRKAATLEEAREEVELFHAYCDAGLWEEADATLVALDRPRYRFLAPAFERELLLRFYPAGDWRQPPLWPGFRHRRALAICCELLGSFEEAVNAYPSGEAALRGDALLALGQLGPLLAERRPPHPWQMLWQAYRAHALCLTGCVDEAVALCGRLVPSDLYEWTHVFECLLRAGRLDVLDMKSFLYRPPHAAESRWDILGRRRMHLDCLRRADAGNPEEVESGYESLIDEYDRGGLVYERALARLSYGRWLLKNEKSGQASAIIETVLGLARRHRMKIIEADAWQLDAEGARLVGDSARAQRAHAAEEQLRVETNYHGPSRP